MLRTLCAALLLCAASVAASAQSAVSPEVVKDLAPTGTLRVAINFGNMVLAQGTHDAPRGVSVDIAHELGKRLGVPVALVTFDAAGKAFESMKAGATDICFMAIEPVRAAEVNFTAPYVLIEGVYMVHKDSPIRSNADVDRPGVRIGVNRASAYDLYLTRTLKNATPVRDANGIEVFIRDKLEATAGVKQAMQAYAKTNPDMRLLEPRFMEIQQAMGTRKDRGEAGVKYLRTFVEEMKASGFVAEGLKRSNQPDAAVAPAAM